jgi:radical SAM superfamily enzyme YgiQ (UPF0313 family)
MGKRFRIKGFEEIEEDIQEAATYGPIGRVFLCDGDALIIPQKKLTPILESVNRHIKGVERIGIYANAKSALRKTPSELKELHDLGLGIAYLGVETGNDELLKKIRKGVDSRQLVEACHKIKNAGITLSVTVILGIGGKEKSIVHAVDTAKILSEIDPPYAGALTIMLVRGTPLYEEYLTGEFVLPDNFDFLEELGLIVAHSDFTNCFFTSNHASNYLPIRARLPQERDRTVKLIYNVIQSKNRGVLRPEYMRAL